MCRCCSGGLWDKQWSYIYHEYPRPRPFAALTAASADMWQLPAYKRPDWCSKLIDENAERWAKLPNHPCSFWTDDYEITNVTGSSGASRRVLAELADNAQGTKRNALKGAGSTRTPQQTQIEFWTWSGI